MAKTYEELNKLAISIRDLAAEQGFTESVVVLGDRSTGQVMIVSFGSSALIKHMETACHTIRDLHGGIEVLSNNSSTQQ